MFRHTPASRVNTVNAQCVVTVSLASDLHCTSHCCCCRLMGGVELSKAHLFLRGSTRSGWCTIKVWCFPVLLIKLSHWHLVKTVPPPNSSCFEFTMNYITMQNQVIFRRVCTRTGNACLQPVINWAPVVGGGSRSVFDCSKDLAAEHPLAFASHFGLACVPSTSSGR